MTDRVNPSFNAEVDSYKVSGIVSRAGGSDGYVQPASSPSLLAQESSNITDADLNAFSETSSGSSFSVTIDAGEAFIYGSWVARDVSSSVSLASSTSNQTVYVGWEQGSTNTPIFGLSGSFGSLDPKIPLYEYDTDGSGVTSVTDLRQIGYEIDASSVVVSDNLTWETTNVYTSGSTLSDGDIALADASGGGFTLTLPPVQDDLQVVIKKIDSTSNVVAVATPNAETIDGGSQLTISNQYTARTITSNESDGNYYII